jgi:hypothetical protein
MGNKEIKLLELFMNNPCLSEEIDYKSEDERRDYYARYIDTLNDQEIDDHIEAFNNY